MKALKFAKRCYEKYLAKDFEGEGPSKKRFRESGGGRKRKAPEVREAMFEWFVNVNCCWQESSKLHFLNRKTFLISFQEG